MRDMKIKLKSLWVIVGLLLLLSCGIGAKGDAGAIADIWLDNNANGVQDAEDIALEGICIWATTDPANYVEDVVRDFCNEPDSSHTYHTDKNGHVPGKEYRIYGILFPGAKCSDVHIYVIVPDGYKATTPTIVNYCEASFGLAKLSP